MHELASVVLTGTADASVAPALEAWLLDVHRNGPYTPHLVIDLVRLEFMNASCIKCFVGLILAIQESAQPYQIRFVANHQVVWQRRSLQALACIAADLVLI